VVIVSALFGPVGYQAFVFPDAASLGPSRLAACFGLSIPSAAFRVLLANTQDSSKLDSKCLLEMKMLLRQHVSRTRNFWPAGSVTRFDQKLTCG